MIRPRFNHENMPLNAPYRPANTRQTITLWIKWLNPTTGLVKPYRKVFKDCFVSYERASVVARTGITPDYDVAVQIFKQKDFNFLPLHEWAKLEELELDSYWSADVVANSPPSVVALFESDREFNPNTLAAITTQENAFISQTPNTFRAHRIEDNMKGTPNAQHILLQLLRPS
jgi:hypothetical protein